MNFYLDKSKRKLYNMVEVIPMGMSYNGNDCNSGQLKNALWSVCTYLYIKYVDKAWHALAYCA